MKPLNRTSFIYFTIIIVCTSLLKIAYIPGLEAESFTQLLYIYFISYEDSILFNIIWLLPIFITVIWVSQEIYLHLMNFNIRYGNRKEYLKKMMIQLLLQTLLYCFASIGIQLVFLVFKTTMAITLDFTVIAFTIKYVFELYLLSLIIVTLAVVIQEFAYSTIFIILLVLVLLENFISLHIPFISLYAGKSFSFSNVIIMIFALLILNKRYVKQNLLGGKER